MSYNNNQTFGSALREVHGSLFGKQWAAWIGGILLAVINIMMFAYEKPWSAAGGVRNWGDWFFNTLDITDKIIISPHLYFSIALIPFWTTISVAGSSARLHRIFPYI